MQALQKRTRVDVLLGRSIRPRWASGYGSVLDVLSLRVCQWLATTERGWLGGGGGVLRLGGVEMNGLRVQLCRRGSAVGDIDADAQRSHDVHSYQHRGRLETDDYNETRSPSGFAPL